ncbi:AAA family ATPase [Vibrio sp. S11_S32]|uniref:AAA family ATPase n=1 Tax=Vibrio sp. S11_S32 TaxID=2720225 RepID=UPI001681C039|nr:AAA family ATPase [Vibrio sp. S11_S32]MBD1577910.1 AAA family ATPase [Vibrio sp. S11_S32]
MKIENAEALLSKQVEQPDEILNGLLRSQIGLIVARPAIGKSHLGLSVAIEVSTGIQLVGLSAKPESQKVLYISSEDPRPIVSKRMKQKIEQLNIAENGLLDSLDFCTDIEPLVIPPDSSEFEKHKYEHYMSGVIGSLSEYDLVIIDTVSEVIGSCCEVANDRDIKHAFKRIAKESNVSILLIHHVTKDEIRKAKSLNVASSSGLSTVGRLVKFMYGMFEVNNKIQLSPLKLNYVDDERATTPIMLERLGALTIATQYKESIKRSISGLALHTKVETSEQPVKKSSNKTESDKLKLEEVRTTKKGRRPNITIDTEPDEILLDTDQLEKTEQDDPWAKVKGLLN